MDFECVTLHVSKRSCKKDIADSATTSGRLSAGCGNVQKDEHTGFILLEGVLFANFLNDLFFGQLIIEP